jgi:hypothetical protein
MAITGSCLCGAVRYAVESAPALAGNCHCRDCQKSSGGPYAPIQFFPESSLTTSGEVRYFAKTGDTGSLAHRGFCPICGSQVFTRADSLPGLIGILAGTLDDTACYKPQVDIYVSSAAPWDHIPPGATTFAKMPPKPGS